MRRAGCHQRVFARQWSMVQQHFYGGQNLRRFGHPARPEFTTGHSTFIRANEQNPIGAQLRHIALRGRMAPHPHIHGRRHQNPRVRGQQQGRGQIVRTPLRHLRHQIGGCRGHHNQIGNPA